MRCYRFACCHSYFTSTRKTTMVVVAVNDGRSVRGTIIITWKTYTKQTNCYSLLLRALFLLLCSSVWRELFIFVCIMQIAGSMRQMERCSHLRHLRGRPTSHFIKLCKCNYLWHPESFLALNIHNGTVSSAINAICRPTIPFFFRIYNLYFRNCDAFSVYFNR